MKDNLMKEYHYFVLTDYEQEEEFLREKHKQGWRFVKVTPPGFYYFEKCEPQDVVYRLDFRPLAGENKESYRQMYRDYGWEYIQDMNEYSYFRKSAENAQENDTEIFSDDESKLDMQKRIFTKRMLPISVIFLFIVIPNVFNVINQEVSAWFTKVSLIFGVIMFVLYAWILTRCGIGFYRLKKKYLHKEA